MRAPFGSCVGTTGLTPALRPRASRRRSVRRQMSQGVHPVNGHPVLAIFELGDAGRRGVHRPQAPGPETKGVEHQEARNHRVRNEDQRAVGVGGAQRIAAPGDPPGYLGEGLAAGTLEALGRRAPPPEVLGEPRGDFVDGHPLPVAEPQLADSVVGPDREPVRRGDGLGRHPRALERARVDGLGAVPAERVRESHALAAAVRAERHVAPAGEPAVPGVLGLRVTYDEDSEAHGNPTILASAGSILKPPARRGVMGIRVLSVATALAAALGAIAGCTTVAATADPSRPRAVIAVSGMGSVSVKPDTALAYLGAEARSATIAAATGDVDRRMRAVLERLRALA